MNDFLRQADRIPVTLVVAIAYVTLFVLANLSVAPEQLPARLDEFGVLTPLNVAEGDAWRLIAAAFLHANMLHIGLNTWALLALGPGIETELGSLRFALLYLVSAIGGHIAVCLVYAPYQGVLGGSGALFGILGAVFALNMRHGRHLFAFLQDEGNRRMIWFTVAYLIAGIWLPVSNTGHIGGLLAGFALTFCWLAPGREPTRNVRRYRIALTALFCSLCFVSLSPAARWDQLWNRSIADESPYGKARRRAATMHYRGIPSADEQDVREFATSEVFR
ncbi:MAG: rhomboid family intramembrane serine protease [bacterium]|nr:rhomboid family intramembrane serine protease [bacterium]